MSEDEAVKRVAGYLRRQFTVEGRDYSGNLRVLVLSDSSDLDLAKKLGVKVDTVQINPYEIVRIAREEPKVVDVRIGHYASSADPHGSGG